jgi:hypothetical protein
MTFMMLDQDVVAVSPSTTYRVLSEAGWMQRWNRKPSKKGTGFVQPLGKHQHWHVDIAYVNLGGTFWYLCVVLDGYSRYVVEWDLRSSMKESDIELVLQRAREKFPEARPRIISDNGPQFIARDFKEFIRLTGMTHVRTRPYYPQSNGKCERVIQTIKVEGLRPASPQDEEETSRVIAKTVAYYNDTRLHSAIGYVTPKDKLEGREREIFAARDRKLEAAREKRRRKREESAKGVDEKGPVDTIALTPAEDRATLESDPSAAADPYGVAVDLTPEGSKAKNSGGLGAEPPRRNRSLQGELFACEN